jgi:LPS-assembly lipoprotein
LFRAAVALIAVVVLTGVGACGFRPMYGPRPVADPVTADLSSIEVARIPDRPGQSLRNQLRDRLNPARLATPTRYTLQVALRESIRELALERSGLATRGNLTMIADFSLIDDTTGQVLLTASSRTQASYNILAGQPTSQFSSLTAQQDARDRALTELAGAIPVRLGSFFEKHPGGAGASGPPATAKTAVTPGFTEQTDQTPGTGGGISGLGPDSPDPE